MQNRRKTMPDNRSTPERMRTGKPRSGFAGGHNEFDVIVKKIDVALSLHSDPTHQADILQSRPRGTFAQIIQTGCEHGMTTRIIAMNTQFHRVAPCQ